MARVARKWPAWPANGPRGPQAARLARKWRDRHEAGALQFFSGNEKIRETIFAAKLAEKQPFETKHEPKEPAKTSPLCYDEPTVEPKHEPKGLFEFASISVH
jgi:hypothetical protein